MIYEARLLILATQIMLMAYMLKKEDAWLFVPQITLAAAFFLMG